MNDNYLSKAGALTWPEHETAIDNTGRNGEVPLGETYKIDETLWRLNHVGRYALYFSKGDWRESQGMTNDMVRARGVMQL